MRTRHLTDLEIEQITSSFATIRDKTLFILGYRTGFRISELLSLTVKDIQGTHLTVRRCNMKGKRISRTVPLHPEVGIAIQAYLAQGQLQADSKLFPITRQHAWRVIKNAARKAGLGGCVATHSMRKSLGMKVYRVTGNNLKAVQLALGHASLESTGHYLSVDADAVESAILA